MPSQLLLETIDTELAWRETELALLKLQLLRDVPDNTRFRCSYRAFVAMTYAHFEGFIKRVLAQALVDIKQIGTKPSKCVYLIQLNLFASEWRKQIEVRSNEDLVVALLGSPGFVDTIPFPSEDIILECANLNIRNFEWAVSCVGLDARSFDEFRPHIGRLVDLRHRCAHGEAISFDSSKTNAELATDIFDTQNHIVTLIHSVAVELINHFEGTAYARP